MSTLTTLSTASGESILELARQHVGERADGEVGSRTAQALGVQL